MALTIKRGTDPDQPEAGALIADRRLWLNAGGTRVVEDGDPAAALQLAAPGLPIRKAEVDRLGLEVVDGRIQQLPNGKRAAPAKHKMAAPSANKGAAPPKSK